MTDYREEVKRLYRSERYREALSLLDTIEQSCKLHPDLLVWKARSLQLLDDMSPYSLADIEAILRKALTIESDYLPAVVDLAYFYLNILDDSERAKPLFEQAFELCQEATTEVVIGLAQCIAELDSNAAARKFLTEVEKLILDPDKQKEAIKELSL